MPKREMLINYVPGEECRIAILEDGRLEEFYQERASAESHVGNIYKGRVSNVEPSIQAAFIEFGLERNGFLHVSDLHPKYFPGDFREESEAVGQKTPRRDRPPIQRCLRRGQEVLVQVLKEGIGTKGPTLTSYLSIPGRFLVMMPHMKQLGVSRKVGDDDTRREMRKILDELKPPRDFGFIVRTAGIGRTKAEIKRDLAYLQRLWKALERRKERVNLGELYTESDLVIRTLRDVYTSDIEHVIVDNDLAARRAADYLAIASPRSGSAVLHYTDPIPMFHRYDVERQIENINARTVPLPSGGSLVIDSTEALVAIDVNSGKMRDHRDADTTAYKTNMEATDEICRQLRLRDLGGVVANDLIDMRDAKHRRAVESRFRDNLKRDRARTKVLAISQFGVLEMTRQRMRPSLKKSIYTDCPHCHGSAHVKSAESVVLDVMRRLTLVMHRAEVARVELTVSPDVAFQLLNAKRVPVARLEESNKKSLLVRVNPVGPIDYVSLECVDSRGSAVNGESLIGLPKPQLQEVETLSIADDEDIDGETSAAEASTTVEDTAPATDSVSQQQAADAAERVEDALDGEVEPAPAEAAPVQPAVTAKRPAASADAQAKEAPIPPRRQEPQSAEEHDRHELSELVGGPREDEHDHPDDQEPQAAQDQDVDAEGSGEEPPSEEGLPAEGTGYGSDTGADGSRRRRRRRGGRRHRRHRDQGFDGGQPVNRPQGQQPPAVRPPPPVAPPPRPLPRVEKPVPPPPEPPSYAPEFAGEHDGDGNSLDEVDGNRREDFPPDGTGPEQPQDGGGDARRGRRRRGRRGRGGRGRGGDLPPQVQSGGDRRPPPPQVQRPAPPRPPVQPPPPPPPSPIPVRRPGGPARPPRPLDDAILRAQMELPPAAPIVVKKIDTGNAGPDDADRGFRPGLKRKHDLSSPVDEGGVSDDDE